MMPRGGDGHSDPGMYTRGDSHNLSNQEVDAGGSGVSSLFQLHRKLEA